MGLFAILATCAAACADTEGLCGDAVCSADESIQSCAADCDFDLVVVVEAELYEPLESHLTAYLDGLVTDGFKGYAVPFNPAPVSELRSFLAEQLLRRNIEGAFLVGNLPTAWYEQEAFGVHETFPMDQYLQDLDAVFADADGNEIFDSHSPLGLEIYTSRVMGDVSALREYFDRVNRFRREGPLVNPSAFVFIDDEWSWKASSYGLEDLYHEVDMIYDPAESTIANYVQKLTGDSAEFVLQMTHSGVHYLEFRGVGPGLLLANQIRAYNFQCSFVHLWNCFSARFVADSNLAMIYTVENDQGLAAIGSTKKGAVRKPEILHSRFVFGEPLGEAFRYWYNTYGHTDDKWALGIVVLGDPMLNIWGDVTGVLEHKLVADSEPERLELMEKIIREHPTPPDLDTFEDYKLAHPQFFRN